MVEPNHYTKMRRAFAETIKTAMEKCRIEPADLIRDVVNQRGNPYDISNFGKVMKKNAPMTYEVADQIAKKLGGHGDSVREAWCAAYLPEPILQRLRLAEQRPSLRADGSTSLQRVMSACRTLADELGDPEREQLANVLNEIAANISRAEWGCFLTPLRLVVKRGLHLWAVETQPEPTIPFRGTGTDDRKPPS